MVQDWQRWQDDVECTSQVHDGLEVRVRTRVRSHGLAGTSRALVLHVMPGDTLDLSVSVHHEAGMNKAMEGESKGSKTGRTLARADDVSAPTEPAATSEAPRDEG